MLSPIVNIQVDGEYLCEDKLTPIMQELIDRNMEATIYVTALFAYKKSVDFRRVYEHGI